MRSYSYLQQVWWDSQENIRVKYEFIVLVNRWNNATVKKSCKLHKTSEECQKSRPKKFMNFLFWVTKHAVDAWWSREKFAVVVGCSTVQYQLTNSGWLSMFYTKMMHDWALEMLASGCTSDSECIQLHFKSSEADNLLLYLSGVFSLKTF